MPPCLWAPKMLTISMIIVPLSTTVCIALVLSCTAKRSIKG